MADHKADFYQALLAEIAEARAKAIEFYQKCRSAGLTDLKADYSMFDNNARVIQAKLDGLA